jgi:hypothetical protein
MRPPSRAPLASETPSRPRPCPFGLGRWIILKRSAYAPLCCRDHLVAHDAVEHPVAVLFQRPSLAFESDPITVRLPVTILNEQQLPCGLPPVGCRWQVVS